MPSRFAPAPAAMRHAPAAADWTPPRRGAPWRLLGLLVLVLAVAGGLFWYFRAPAAYSGAPVLADPLHAALTDTRQRRLGDWVITPLERIRERGRVLMWRGYDDDLASLIPMDLALGWRQMSDPAYLARMQLSQSHRFLYWRWQDRSISEGDVIANSKNIHVVPGNADVAAELHALRPNQVVELEGVLVQATRLTDGMTVISSLRHDDTGGGACQVMLVWGVNVLPG